MISIHMLVYILLVVVLQLIHTSKALSQLHFKLNYLLVSLMTSLEILNQKNNNNKQPPLISSPPHIYLTTWLHG